jgi:HAD superfamily hydrolase (TIGR01509 family)
MQPKFFYFDLGNVLVTFDVGVMCRQMGAVSGLDPAVVHGAIFDARLLEQLERGAIGDEEFFEAFCRKTGVRPDYAATARAASDIFQLRAEIVPLVSGLHRAGHRLGILSNTSQMHWDHCRRRYDLLSLFEVPALSYRLKVAKPDEAIYRAATELAGVAPHEVFFTDDQVRHVDGARAFGWDAVLFTSAAQLAAELAQRGVRWNA